jgi:hypothetical protein
MIFSAGRGPIIKTKTLPLTEIFSTEFTSYNTGLADPWDDSITVPTGSNRLLLVILGLSNPGTDACVLDPATLNISLTEITGSPAFFAATDENAIGFSLAESAFSTATGSLVLRYNPTAGRRGGKRVIGFRNARQTLSSAGNNIDGGALTVTVNRNGGGNFAAGSLVYAWCHGEASGAYTVTGDATEVVDLTIGTVNDQWIFAKGTLASAAASASVTFTRDAGGTTQKGGLIFVVEQA